jgi:hypothetical protein
LKAELFKKKAVSLGLRRWARSDEIQNGKLLSIFLDYRPLGPKSPKAGLSSSLAASLPMLFHPEGDGLAMHLASGKQVREGLGDDVRELQARHGDSDFWREKPNFWIDGSGFTLKRYAFP